MRKVGCFGESASELRMLRLPEPIDGRLAKLVDRHARVRGEPRHESLFLREGRDGLEIFLEERLVRLRRPQLGLESGEMLELIQGEEHLHLHRVFAPQRAVVVERGNALRRRHIIAAAFACHAPDQVEDRLFRGAVIPGRKGVSHGTLR